MFIEMSPHILTAVFFEYVLVSLVESLEVGLDF